MVTAGLQKRPEVSVLTRLAARPSVCLFMCVAVCLLCLISERLRRCKLNLWIQYHWPTYWWHGLIQGIDFWRTGLVIQWRQRLSGSAHIGVTLRAVQAVVQGCLRCTPAVRLNTSITGKQRGIRKIYQDDERQKKCLRLSSSLSVSLMFFGVT